MRNSGGTATPSSTWSDAAVLSTNEVFGDGDDIALASVRHSGSLAPGGSYPVSIDAPVPVGLSGPYRLLVKTDTVGEVEEFTFESNNVAQPPAPLDVLPPDFADLYARNVIAPTFAVGGIGLTVTWRVDNLGPNVTGNGTVGSVVAQWNDRIVASVNAVYGDADDRELAVVAHQGELQAGVGYDGSWTGALPTGLSGDFHIFVPRMRATRSTSTPAQESMPPSRLTRRASHLSRSPTWKSRSSRRQKSPISATRWLCAGPS